MARKAVRGYPEKSFYDNTVFGGIVATGDPLNEGSFALLSNLDIADTGKSVKPRKGFLSTVLNINNQNMHLSDKILYFRDINLRKDIIIDLNNFNLAEESFAYKGDFTQYSVVDKLMPAEFISRGGLDYIDMVNLANSKIYFDENTSDEAKLKHLFQYSNIVDSMELKPIVDITLTRYYITKMFYSYNNVQFKYVLKVLYREQGSEGFSSDTLVFSFVNMSEQTTSLLPSSRNVASRKSVIMDPLRSVATDILSELDLVLPETLPLQYDGRYASSAPLRLKAAPQSIKIVPTFMLPTAISNFVGSSGASWAYRFDITNTSTNSDGNVKAYRTPWRTLSKATGTVNASTDNLPITKVHIPSDHAEDNISRYYLVSLTPNNKHTTTATINETISQRNVKLFDKMRLNGEAGSQSSSLGNLLQAFNTGVAISSVLKDITADNISSINPLLFETLGYGFIKESDVALQLNTYYGNLELQRNRVNSLTPTALAALTGAGRGWVNIDNSPRWSPSLTFDTAKYELIPKLNISQFKSAIIEDIKNNDIEIIFLPWTHETTQIGGVNNKIHLASFNAIYVDGLNAQYNPSTYPFPNVPTYDFTHTKRNEVIGTKISWVPRTGVMYTDGGQDITNLTLKSLIDGGVPSSAFDNSVAVTLYLKPISDEMINDIASDLTVQDKENIINLWDASSYTISANYLWSKQDAFINEVLTEHADAIEQANQFIVFEDRIVTWYGNRVYISEEGNYYFFKQDMIKEFPEELLKVIAFKNVLLVFGVQNMFAIYRAELDTATGAYNEEGVPEYTKVITWLQQPVLYNLNPDRRYLNVIQIYNQMILFYSNEGQLYMIQPSTTIDSDTQFSIRYFNKSANDIIANYEHYITERLRTYAKITTEDDEQNITKDKVRINCLVDIDTIKIFYTVPGEITFILIYDVINNRYSTYDTLSFTDITLLKHVEGGELYFTKRGSTQYLTMPIAPEVGSDMHNDLHFVRQFKKEPIFALIDSGNLNLNNHITKRLRDLKLVIKNIDASKILYTAEVYLDDTRVRSFYAPDFKVTMTNGPTHTMTVEQTPVEDINELFGMNQTIGEAGSRDGVKAYYLHNDKEFFENNALLKTETLNSNRLIEYNSSILGMGKVIRIKLQFIAKGSYKVQSFAIVYKERQV